MDQHCRFCGEKRENLSSIEDLDLRIVVWLSKIIDLREENLPNNICYTCLCTIEDINHFISKILKTYESFKNEIFALETERHQNDENTSLMSSYEKEVMNEEYLLDNENNMDEVNHFLLDNNEIISCQKRPDTEKLLKPTQTYICSLELNTTAEKPTHSAIHDKKKDVNKFNYKCRFCEFECNDREKIAFHMKADHLNNNKNALFKDLLAIVVDQKTLTNNSNKNPNINFGSCTENLVNISSTIVGEINNVSNGSKTKSINFENGIDYMKLLNLADVYECKICKINFSKKISFNKHWDAIHLTREEKELRKEKRKSRDQYLCPECGKSLPTAFKLDYHIRMHKNDRRYKCNLCPKSYFSKSHLEVHSNSHSGNISNKVYICKSCEKKFRTPHELKIHTRFHGSDKPFECGICNKTFYIVSHLNEHKKAHTNEKNFICSFLNCAASYRNKRSLRRHSIKHVLDDNKTYSSILDEKKL
ncbi:zinc finger protein 33A-like isoform X2 [Condylostylus longicornis]|uniref:zinc finger protein 33A-like isoform X2 n=1 Tax=Condylostylus longicornis TaxID=2530218 RepID=UPI00244E2129|nr:zinc finger protein 33A-like isoform X2 [Condylostylus longicornis]